MGLPGLPRHPLQDAKLIRALGKPHYKHTQAKLNL